MSIITDEMVQAALLVAHNMRRGWYGLPLLSDSSSLGIHGGLGDMNEAEVIRAALAAVAPAIEAAALERAAVVADQLPSPDFIYDWPDAIAAAIRALKEAT